MTDEGLELTIHSLDREQTIYDLVKACRLLRPSSIRVDTAGRGTSVLHELKAAGLPARPLQKFRRLLERDETGRPYFVEGPDDDMAERWTGEWQGQYCICRLDDRSEWRVYELVEPEPVHGMIARVRWQRVLDEGVLGKVLGSRYRR